MTNEIEWTIQVRYVVLEKFISEIYPNFAFKGFWLIVHHTELNKIIKVNNKPISCFAATFPILGARVHYFPAFFERTSSGCILIGQETIGEAKLTHQSMISTFRTRFQHFAQWFHIFAMWFG